MAHKLTPAMRDKLYAAFIAGKDQGGDEATSYEWGSVPSRTTAQAFDDFIAEIERLDRITDKGREALK